MTAIDHPHGQQALDRALPGLYVDKIRFGLPEKDARDHRKIYGACVGAAMSARRRGWSEAQFLHEVARDESVLWLQLRRRRGGGLRSSASAYRDLHKAWKTAVANLRDVGKRSAEEVRDDAVERATLWVDRLTDGVDDLTETESGVLSYVIAETERRGMFRVTCPGREVAEFAKLTHPSAVRALKSLTRKGFLIKHYSGRGGATATGKAAIYELSDPAVFV
jgi:hypothetical protein